MTFPSYPEYQEAGVEWLGDVPEHWRSVPIKYMALERSSLFLDGDWIESKDISSEGIRYITTGNVGEGSYKEQGAGFISEETFHSLGCTDVYEGDVLISRLNNPIGRACVTPDLGGRVVTSVDNVIFRPDSRFHKKFIVYLFSSEEYFRHTGNLARGATMQRISRGLLGNIRVVTPSLEEQAHIARFLDHETARIDALIEEQQRLIELLKEKRQAVISQAVTKGLDPTVPMKDSGVEWLGEVPVHWEVVRLKNTSRIVDCKNRTPEYVDDGEYLVVRTSNIKKQQLSLDNALYTNRDNYEIWTERGIPPPGSIFFTREAPSGEVCIVPADTALCMGQRMMNIIPIDSELTPFIFDFLTSDCLTKYIESEASGSTVVHLRVEQVFNIPLVIPPKIERDEIDKLVGELKTQYEDLIAQSEASVVLLYERRSALISAAVTGKIDVRGWQPPASASFTESAQETV